MLYSTKKVVITGVAYKKGMEDGFLKTDAWGDCSICQKNCKDCPEYKPYVNTAGGRVILNEGDYIITAIDGMLVGKYPMSKDVFEALLKQEG